MKILFLSHHFYPSVGGIETVSDILTGAFHKAGHEVRVMTWTKQEGNRDFPFLIIRNPSAGQMMREHRRADIVFENNPTIRLGWPRLLFRRKTVIALHTWITKKGKKDIGYWLKQKYIGTAGKVIACSDAVRRYNWPNAIVIENPYRDSVFKRLPNIQKTKTFVFLGRLVSDKGPALAVKAFQKLVSDIMQDSNKNEPSLTIVGEGPERESLEKIVTNARLEEKMQFAGTLTGEALVACLNEHHFILVPSVWDEPFGLVVLEGMACGCVPIVSDSGGLPDAAGKAGVSFRKGDVDELSEVMRSLLLHPEEEERLWAEAAEHLERHTVSVVAKRYLREVESLSNFYKQD